MLKLLNILVIAYLAIAPGMNVETLIHSVHLCRVVAPQVAQAPAPAPACEHNHNDGRTPDDTGDDENSDSCPHLSSTVAPATAMPVVPVRSFATQGCPTPDEIRPFSPLIANAGVCQADNSRPPPGPDSTDTTILHL